MPTDIVKSYGLSLSHQFLEQPESGRIGMTAEGIITVSRIWKTNYNFALANTPYPRSADPGGLNALCINVAIEPIPPDMALVTADYQGFFVMPFTIYEFQNARMERPITMHPRFLNASYFPEACKIFDVPDAVNAPTVKAFVKFKDVGTSGDPNLKFAGIESYIVGNAMWRKTSYSNVPDFSQTDVGSLNAPEYGPYGATLPDASNAGKHWLKVDKTCRNTYRGASMLWEISEQWLYNSLGWVLEIYGP